MLRPFAAAVLGVPLGSKLVGWRRQTSKSLKCCRGNILRLQSCEILKTHKKVKTLLQLSPSSKCSKVSRHVRPIHAVKWRAERARSKISSKSSKVPKLMQLRRILKIFKSLGLPAFKPSKHILKFENPPKPQKFSNLRIVLNPRGRPRPSADHH